MEARPIFAGLTLAVVGFASSFAVVLAGLRAVGASDGQAASGLLALCLTTGLAGIWLALRYRMPISVAWSTPGAALLASVGGQHIGFGTAVTAFLITGALLTAAGLSARLTALIEKIPAAVASAMLAGVLLPLCVAPVQAVVRYPGPAVPIVVVWAVLHRFARRWAVPGALAAALVAIMASYPAVAHGHLAPSLTLTVPHPDLTAALGLAIPLFLVTMVSQNVAGMAMLATFDYRPPLRPLLVTTGVGTLAAAPFGGHAVNLAAITAALAAGPDAHPDPRRRWIASATAGCTYVLLGLTAGLAVTLIAAAPPLLVESVAGLALLGTLGAALSSAVADPGERDAAVVAFAVTAAGISPLGVGAAFWALVASLTFRAVFRVSRAAPTASPDPSRTRR